jgi:hypothetical protein
VHTWFWQSGFDGRPRHVFQVELAAARSGLATITDVEASWDAGGVADGGGCSSVSGARLLVLQSGSWDVVAEHSANTFNPATLHWAFSTDESWQLPGATLSTLLLPRSGTISVAAEPKGDSGCYARRAQITSDYVEVRIAYRQPKLTLP